MNTWLAGGVGTAIGLGLGVGAVLMLSGCGGSPVRVVAYDPNAPVFPQVSGDNLNGRQIEFPGGIDAPYAVLLVAFFQRQQEDVNTWLPTAEQIAADHANVEYYELPTIARGWTLVRGWVDGGMRSGIPAFAARERTVTVYTDVDKFRQLAGIDSPEQIWVGLIDREGRVYYTARGRATDTELDRLRQTVRTIASPQAAQFR